MSEDAAAPTPTSIPAPAAEPRAGAAPAKHLRPSLLAALAAPVRKLWPRETDLGRIGMAIAAPVLCWVFYTTSSGMVDIMQKEPGDWIGLGGAVIATTAILVMLASTSWSLGADLASLIAMRRMARERVIIKTSITAVVFVFVFSISAFFSFTYYYNNIFKLSSKKIVGELQPMELAADIVLPTAKEVAARYDENTAQLEATPGFKSYLDQLEALSETARTADATLRESIRKSQEARQRVALEAARRAAADLAEAQAASRQLADAKARIQQLERGAADLDAIIKAKQEEISGLETTAKQEEQAAVDASKGLDGLGASCGPNCLSHRAKSMEAQKRIATIRETLKGPITERANALRRRDALDAEAISLKLKADSGAEAQARPLPKGETAPDLGAMLHQLAALRDELRADPSWRVVREAKPLCEAILFAARGDFACEPIGAQARDRLTARDEMTAARAVFDRKCSLEGELRDEIGAVANHIREASATDPTAAASGFNEAKKLVDACVVAGKPAGLSEADVRALLKRSDDFLRAHTTERNKFELAREAFWSFTPDATMAICVAMAQDAFVFIMKFLSEIFKRGLETRERRQFVAPQDLTDSEADPVETRAMKAVMRAARPVHGDMSEIDPEAATFALLPLNVRENLTALLNRLVRDEIAHVDRKGYYGDPSGEPARRRRPSALERYLTHIPEPEEVAAAPGERAR